MAGKQGTFSLPLRPADSGKGGPSPTSGPTINEPSQVRDLKAMIAFTLRDVVTFNKLLQSMTKNPQELNNEEEKEFFLDVENLVKGTYDLWKESGSGITAENFLKFQSRNGDSIEIAEYEALSRGNFEQIQTGKLLPKLATRLIDQSRTGSSLVFRTSITANVQKQKPTLQLEANDGALLFDEGKLPEYAKKLQLIITARLAAIISYNAYVGSSTASAAGRQERVRYLSLFLFDLDKMYTPDFLLHAAAIYMRNHTTTSCSIRKLAEPFNNEEEFYKALEGYDDDKDTCQEQGRRLLDSLLSAVYALPDILVKDPSKQKAE